MTKCDARYTDGREYICGDKPTSADFKLLALYTTFVTNEHLHNATFAERMQELYSKCDNVQRIITNMKALNGIEDAIANLP